MKRIPTNTLKFWIRFMPPALLALLGLGGSLQNGLTYGVILLYGLAIGWLIFSLGDHFFEKWLKSRSKLQNSTFVQMEEKENKLHHADFDGFGREK